MRTPAPSRARPVVLVVDDEPLIRWSLAEGLTDGGFDVRLAGSGAEARATLASSGGPVVVLLDVRLPDVADLSLLREIRSRWPAAPVIVITAHGTDRDASDAAALGAFSVVQKPFDVTEIVRLVGQAADPRPT